MNNIAVNLQAVQQQIYQAEQQSKRERCSVKLLAVSKTRSANELETVIKQGQIDFGENYLQEALDKQIQLNNSQVIWHFIGSIQSNKTKAIAENFSWVHSVDRLKIASRLNEQRPPHLSPLNILVQINVSLEHSKSGILQHQLMSLATEIEQLPHLRLRGIMGLPAPTTKFSEQQKQCETLASLYNQLKQSQKTIDTLSMGTSNDYQAAIAAGSTMVRIGTAIFGPRTQ
ncbi:UPF0001 protein YggS [hydrothermal vent metagenome]|uniref:UPF0001 protein YggS n=1 Tax=hydrothermal vent metagenome TaxID=652676 RepID=A0A3B0YFG5_9ZZZZ